MKRLRGAVIGCGMIAEFHLRSWQRIPEVEIVALADPAREKAEDCRARYAPGATVYADFGEVLAGGSLDFVDVLSPPKFHAEHCRRAWGAGLHVACQKPLCENLAEARGLVAELSGDQRLFCVHENHVYRPWFQRLLALHREGFFGALRRVQLEQNDPTSPPQALNREAERGVLLQYGVHFADMIRHLLGPPEQVTARLHRLNPEIRGESLAQVVFSYPGCTATIDVAWKNGVIAQGGAWLLGERAEAFYEGTMIRGADARLRLTQGTQSVADEIRSTTGDYVEAFYLFERAFADAMLGRGPEPQPAGENLQTLAMTFAGYTSAEQKSPVNFAEFARTSSIPLSP
jgi:predicted dehydrogenase